MSGLVVFLISVTASIAKKPCSNAAVCQPQQNITRDIHTPSHFLDVYHIEAANSLCVIISCTLYTSRTSRQAVIISALFCANPYVCNCESSWTSLAHSHIIIKSCPLMHLCAAVMLRFLRVRAGRLCSWQLCRIPFTLLTLAA